MSEGVVFPGLVHNRQGFYAKAITNNGCEVYVPGNSEDHVRLVRDELQQWLDAQKPFAKIIA